jgi:hypothetical protein
MVSDAVMRVIEAFTINPTLYAYMLGGVAAALLLFLCRTYRRSLYGCLEIAIGLALMILSIQLKVGDFSFVQTTTGNDFQAYETTLAGTTFLGGIFVMVRGFDNVREGRLSRRRIAKSIRANDFRE